jgi:TIR domain
MGGGGTDTDEQGRAGTEGGRVFSKVFISYSHKDAAWKERVLKHLRVLESAGEFTVWDDQRIKAGDAWLPEIEAAMSSAQVLAVR